MQKCICTFSYAFIYNVLVIQRRTMISAFILAMVLVILSEGLGHQILQRLRIRINGFAAPAGLAMIFGTMELLLLPRMALNGSGRGVTGSMLLVLVIALICVALRYKEVFHSLFRARTIYVLLSALLLMLLFKICGSQIVYADDPELALIGANVGKAHIDLGPARLQGYELFAGFILRRMHGNYENTALMLALSANMITVMLILDIIDSYRIGNPWFRFTLIFAMIFYSQFYSWKITGSFHGSNWRLVFIALILFVTCQWLKTENENIRYLLLPAIMAGYFTSSGFYMVSVEIIYCVFVYLFHIHKIRSLYDLITILIPVMLYTSMWLTQYSSLAAEGLMVAYVLLLIARHRKNVYHRIIEIENLLMDHSTRIFYIMIPVIFLIGTFILRFFVPGYGFEYSHYIDYFSSRPISSYLFLNHNVIDIILDVFRWGGLVVFLFRAFEKEECMMRSVFLGMAVFFINPLCTGMLSKIVGMEAYANAFEIVFNPFTDIMIFYWIYRQFEWTVIGQWVLELTLVFATLFGHAASYMNLHSGLYTDLINQAERTQEVKQP